VGGSANTSFAAYAAPTTALQQLEQLPCIVTMGKALEMLLKKRA